MNNQYSPGDRVRAKQTIHATGRKPGYDGKVKGTIPTGMEGSVVADDGGKNIEAAFDVDSQTKDTRWTVPRNKVELVSQQ
jgi:hypothetical protein